MTGIVGTVLVGIAAIWALSALIATVFITRALVGDPAVVVDDPWAPEAEEDLARSERGPRVVRGPQAARRHGRHPHIPAPRHAA